jgi:hypothetical protein
MCAFSWLGIFIIEFAFPGWLGDSNSKFGGNVKQFDEYECDLLNMGENKGAYHCNLGVCLANQKRARNGKRKTTSERLVDWTPKLPL